MIKRLLGAALLAVLLLTASLPTVAVAAEDTAAEGGEAVGPPPGIDEIGTDVARSEGFFPEEYVSPTWFQWVLYPVIAVGILMALGILVYYLVRQPSFAEERREKSRSR